MLLEKEKCLTPDKSSYDKLVTSLEQVNSLILMTDLKGTIFYANEAYQLSSGYSAHELCQQHVRSFRSGFHDDSFYQELWNTVLSGNQFTARFVNKKKDGQFFHEEKTITPIYNQSNELSHFISVAKEIPLEQRFHQELSFYVQNDAMTGLANRMTFLKHLESNAVRSSRLHGSHFAVFFIDLDHFKSINDTLGHKAGDQVLIETAKRLSLSVREGDICARLGGDEFALLLVDTGEVAHLAAIAKKLIEKVSQTIDYDNHQLHISCSIGISIFNKDSDDGQELFNLADTAMYASKQLGAGHFSFVRHNVDGDNDRLLRLQQDILLAQENDELQLYYQPQVNLDSQAIERVEALLRWNHPTLGCIEPGELIPLLESCGLMCDIGRWVIKEACHQSQQWQEQGQQEVNVSVNLSGHQLIQRDFVDSVADIMKEQNINPQSNFFLEINEDLLIGDMVLTMDKFKGLNDIGVGICLDDYTSGQISLTELNNSNVRILKINRKFIQGIPHDEESKAVVVSIIAIGHALGMKITAVGVETPEQYQFLKQHGCDFGQGYLFYPPVSGNDVLALL